MHFTVKFVDTIFTPKRILYVLLLHKVYLFWLVRRFMNYFYEFSGNLTSHNSELSSYSKFYLF